MRRLSWWPAWVVSVNEALDENGTVIAKTTFTDYILVDGVRFPSVIESEFLPEQTRLKVKIRNAYDLRINTNLDDSHFQFPWRPSDHD